MFSQSNQIFEAMIYWYDQKHEDLKQSRGKQQKYSKNIGNKLINTTSVNTYTESITNTTTPPQFISEDYADTRIQATFAWSDQIFEKKHGELNELRRK